MDPIDIELRSASANTIRSRLSDASTYVLGGDGVVVPDAGTAGCGQLRLVTENKQLYVAPGGDMPVMVNGRTIADRTHVNDGDWVTIGGTVYQIKLGGAGAPTHAPSAPAAEVFDITADAGAQASTPRTGPPTGPRTGPRTQPRTEPGSATAHAGTLIIGRQKGCALTIDSPLVSREHARLTQEAGQWWLEDLASTNGTFVNAHRIATRTLINPGDRIAIATFLYRFTGDGLMADGEEGRIRVEAVGITKELRARAGGEPRKLLEDISLVIEPGEFVVIFGGSGSGKSTLLDALNGRRPASGGRVLYNGVDLYESFDIFRSTIGYVPQQDIVHRRLKVRRALEYTARLRLPPDTSEQEIAKYVEEVLQSVRLQDKAELLIDTPSPLSGGQLKRVSLASELVARPGILFLDEVTSGLDAGTDRQMMQTFAELADGGRTVACVTHSLENIADTADLVVLLHRGRLAYFGPPGEVCGHFRIKRLADIYELLETRPPEQWAAEFRTSRHYQQYVTARLSPAAQAPAAPAPRRSRPAPAGKGQGGGFWTQTKILTRRYIDLVLGDRRNLAILLLQAPLIGAVIGTVFDTGGELPARAVAEAQVSFMLVLSAIWFGCLNSAREFVKELPVYLRERSVNLGLAPYMLSKLGPLAVICLAQCALLLAVVSGLLDLPGPFGPRLLLLTAAAFGATAMGLAVSAFADSNDKAIAMVPILLIPQVVLSNAIVRLDGATLWAAKLSMISFWSYDAMKSTLTGDILGLKDASGRAVVPVLETYGRGLLAIALMTVVFLILAWVGLRLKDRRG